MCAMASFLNGLPLPNGLGLLSRWPVSFPNGLPPSRVALTTGASWSLYVLADTRQDPDPRELVSVCAG